MYRLKKYRLKIRVDLKLRCIIKICCIKFISIVFNATPLHSNLAAHRRATVSRLATAFPKLAATTLFSVILSGCSANFTQVFNASDDSANRAGKGGVPKQENSGTSAKGSPDFSNKYKELGQLSPLCNDAALRNVKGSSKKGAAIFAIHSVSCEAKRELLVLVDRLGGVSILTESILKPRTVLEEEATTVTHSALDRSGRYLALAYGNEVEVVDLKSQARARLTTLKPKTTSLSFDAEGLVIGAADGRLYRWFYGEDRALERYIGPASVISAVVTHPAGRVFISGDWDGALNVWLNYADRPDTSFLDLKLFPGRFETEHGVRVRANRADSEPIQQLVMDADGAELFLTTQSGVLESWQVRGFYQIASIQAHQGLIYALAVRADGAEIVTAGRDGFVRRWTTTPIANDYPGSKRRAEFKLMGELPFGQVSALAYLGSAVYAADSSGNLQRIVWPAQ